MNIVQYVREKGIRHVITILYQYKIQIVLDKIVAVIYRRRPIKDLIILESHNDFDCNNGAFYQ